MICTRVFNAHPKYKRRHATTIRLAQRIFYNEGKHDADLSVVFVNDRSIARLNHRFLRRPYPTDVIAFSLGNGPTEIEGEVYVNLDRASHQANEYHVTLAEEVNRLVAHGILHLLGYRDGTERERKKMTMREIFTLPDDHGTRRVWRAFMVQ